MTANRYGILCEQMDYEEEGAQEGPEGQEAQEGHTQRNSLGQ